MGWEWTARPDQLPANDLLWFVWLILAGRGWGKTRVGSETVIDEAKSGRSKRIALVGRTAADVRDVMVQGESGILAVSPADFRPRYLPSQRKLVWPNGAIATTYSGDKPDQLRGPQHDFAWADELAAWRYSDAWDQLMFGLRLGTRPRAVATTTPRPTKIIRELSKRDTTVVTRGRTIDNSANLAGSFLDEMKKRYEGTRLGRQELDGEVLDDNPGALWSYGLLDKLRWRKPAIVTPAQVYHPPLRRVVIGVDPAVSAKSTSDETGIVVCGLGADGHLYVLDDLSGIYTPHQWAMAVARAAIRWNADAAICEVNNGGDLVEANIRTVTQKLRVLKVHAAHGKYTRAEPVSSIYERGMAHHCGTHATLETQMCEWNPKIDDDSPDRVDALVWAMTELSGINQNTGAVRRSA